MLVITGATGFVASQLVPLIAQDRHLILAARQASSLEVGGRELQVRDYRDLANCSLQGATIIHLAVRNNDSPGTAEEFHAANVDFLLEIAASAKASGARRFINLCSTRALDPKQGDRYGWSKGEGARRLREFWPEGAVNLYIPAVHGSDLRGKLKMVAGLPSAVKQWVLAVLRLVKPMISIDALNRALDDATICELDPTNSWSGEIYRADPQPAHGLFALTKRTIDLLAAVGVLLLAGWAMVLIAICIRIDSRGAAIFAQRRVGREDREFTCYKFRTMSLGTANAATHSVSAAAVTRAGRFLRKTKLDELPQVFNVLRNEMSLVGPRPCLPIQHELISARRQRGVLAIKPGITGLAQVQHVDMSDPNRLAAWDDRYCAFRTILSDAALLIRTVLGGGTGDRVANVLP